MGEAGAGVLGAVGLELLGEVLSDQVDGAGEPAWASYIRSDLV